MYEVDGFDKLGGDIYGQISKGCKRDTYAEKNRKAGWWLVVICYQMGL